MPKKHSKSDHADEHHRHRKSSHSKDSEPIELLTQKQNGSAVDADGAGRQNKTTIKGMWKKAFKSIKTKDKDKDKDKGDPSGEKSDGKFQSRMSTRQSSLKKALRRKDSKEASDTESQVPEVVNPRRDPGSMDPVFATLRSASYMRKPRSGASSSSETHLESLNESFENDPIVQPGTSDYEDSYGSYSAKK